MDREHVVLGERMILSALNTAVNGYNLGVIAQWNDTTGVRHTLLSFSDFEFAGAKEAGEACGIGKESGHGVE